VKVIIKILKKHVFNSEIDNKNIKNNMCLIVKLLIKI